MRLLRLVTGLVIASFVIGHFQPRARHGVDRGDGPLRFMLASWWRSPVGTFLLYGSLLTHFVLARQASTVAARCACRSGRRRSSCSGSRSRRFSSCISSARAFLDAARPRHRLRARGGLLWSSEWSAIASRSCSSSSGRTLLRAALLAAGALVVPRRRSRSPSRSRCSCPPRALRLRERRVLPLAEHRERRRHAEVQRRPRRHERQGPRADGESALGPRMGILDPARRHAARALAAHAHRRHLPRAPRVRP